MEGDDDEEGDEMEEDEGEDDGDWRFEKVDGERSTPTREVEIVDMDSNEPVSQELPRLKDHITHHSNANNHLLPSSPPTISNPASMQHGTETPNLLSPSLAHDPLPSPSTANTAPQDQLSSDNNVTSRPKRNV